MKAIITTIFCAIVFVTTMAQQAPNIVILFVDDLGWADVGYRNPEFYTPNIDKLHEEGVDFSRAYVCTPTCSPSRAAILTGKELKSLLMKSHNF